MAELLSTTWTASLEARIADAANGKAEWDSKKETLKITARILDAEY